MRSHLRALSLLVCVSACTTDGDYQVAVTWLINGTTPNADMCAEHGIARARFDVRSSGGRRVKTVEGNCDETINITLGEFGGFYTNASFFWDERYDYTLTLIDAAGRDVSVPAQDYFEVGWDEADIFELNYLDYVAPSGNSASFSADWQFSNGSPDTLAGDCASQQVSKVRIFATSGLDDDLVDSVQLAEAACTDGRFVSNGNILATGDYYFFMQAIAADGHVVTTSDTQSVFVDFGQQIALMRTIFAR